MPHIAVCAQEDAARALLISALEAAGYRAASRGAGPSAIVVADAPSGRDRWPTLEAVRAEVRVPIVCVVDQIDWRGVRAIIGQGAQGIVFADRVERTLPSAVAAVISGQLVMPHELATGVARPAFSPREKQVLGMVVMGLRNAEIARTLFISEATVKSHLAAAFAKLGVRSRSEATALILDPENGLGLGILEISGDERGATKATLPGVNDRL